MLSTFPTTNSNSQIPDYLALQLYSSHKATRDTKSTVVQYSPLRRGESFRRSLMLSPFLLLVTGWRYIAPLHCAATGQLPARSQYQRDFELKTFVLLYGQPFPFSTVLLYRRHSERGCGASREQHGGAGRLLIGISLGARLRTRFHLSLAFYSRRLAYPPLSHVLGHQYSLRVLQLRDHFQCCLSQVHQANWERSPRPPTR